MSEQARATPAFFDCSDCREYAHRRGQVVEPAISKVAKKHGVHVRRLAHLFLLGVHQRHLSGKAL